MQDDEEPSLLQYARYHGLARDHTLEDDDDVDYTRSIPADPSADLADPKHVPSIQLPANFTLAEKIPLDAQAKAFLALITAVPKASPDICLDHLDVRSFRWRKLDLPLLSTDHELDVRYSGRHSFDDTVPSNCLPFKLDEEQDESLEWPARFHSLPDLYNAQLKTEKLAASKESFLLLKSIMSGGDTLHAEEMFAEELKYQKNRSLLPLTPPLSPLTPPLDANDPTSPIEYIGPLSEHTSPLAAEIKALDKRVMGADLIRPLAETRQIWSTQDPLHTDELEEYLNSEASSIPVVPSSSPLRAMAMKLKIEEPLTPPTTLEAATSAACSDSIDCIIPGLLPLRDEQTLASEETFESLFNDVVCVQALKAESYLENEHLQEADSTKRVTVPTMNFSVPTPPWKMPFSAVQDEAENHELSKLIARMKMHHLPVSKIDRQLTWAPFPLGLGKIPLEEKLEGEGLVEEFVDQSTFDTGVDFEILTWKPDGLRILDHSDDEEEEELQPASSEEPNDITSLLKKRKIKLLSEDVSRAGAGDGEEIRPVIHGPKDRSSAQDVLGAPLPAAHHNHFGDRFCASDELSRFIGIQTGRMKRRKTETNGSVEFSPITSRTQALTEEQEEQTPIVISTLSKPQPLPGPGTEPSHTPRQIIVSTTFLAQIHMIHHIARLYPAVDLVERGNVHLGHADGPAGGQRFQSSCDDADLTITPGTGIICTSLQQIKQKPLPGQAKSTIIRDIVTTVAPRYDKLIVLVSAKSNASVTSPLEERDCQALTDLIIFTAGLDDEISIHFVAGGDEDLARWIVGIMAVTTPLRADLKLLQDETLWEIFLRKAGMNAFAAQAVLSELKASSDDAAFSSDSGAEQMFGLPAFVSMSADERVGRLKGVLEGRKVLMRVSAVLDAPWGLARHEKGL